MYKQGHVTRRALPRMGAVLALHVLVLLAFIAGDRIVHPRTPETAMVLTNVVPEVKPPSPPREVTVRHPNPHKAAARQLRDLDVVPETEIVATISDAPMPVDVAGGKVDSFGMADAGDKGAGVGGGAAKVGAVFDHCVRPKLPRWAEERGLAGHVILEVLVDVDGRVKDARVTRSSGIPILDQTALAGARACSFVPATVDKVPTMSWEPFRFSWVNR